MGVCEGQIIHLMIFADERGTCERIDDDCFEQEISLKTNVFYSFLVVIKNINDNVYKKC